MPDRIPMRIAHALPGRTRLVPLGQTDAEVLRSCAARLEELDGVTVAIRGNSLILTHRDPWAEISAALDHVGLTLACHATRVPIATMAAAVGRLDARISAASAGRMDLTNAAFLGLMAGGIVQLVRGNLAGPAATLFSQALTLALLHTKAQER
ncbi:hypothetical protein [Xanthobacter agilis]|uniref:Uncharacterized protein n=1 Tax=Xanthobacter agilis TaxID=47492 RepID=A0ABU0LA86_XANAG|nr:hypothetical protein [Xanthobacter agilis]MDQ0504046.1 hypothetical protein [Xanthobacter agilis]